MKNKALALLNAFLYLMLFLSCIVVSAFFSVFLGQSGFTAIFTAFFCVGALCLIKRKRAENLKEAFALVKIPRKSVAVIMGLTVAATLSVQCLQLIMPPAYVEQTPQFSLPYGGLSFISLVVTSPIAEEVYFRGFILKGLADNFPPIVAVMITSFLFAGLHSGLVWGLMALIISIFYSVVFLRYKSIFAPVIAHITSNCIAVTFNLLMLGSQ